MSHQEYIDSCSEDQLNRLVEMAQDKIAVYRKREKTDYLVVGDDWSNMKHFRRDDTEAALECFSKIYRAKVIDKRFDNLGIEVIKYFPEEIEDVL